MGPPCHPPPLPPESRGHVTSGCGSLAAPGQRGRGGRERLLGPARRRPVGVIVPPPQSLVEILEVAVAAVRGPCATMGSQQGEGSGQGL